MFGASKAVKDILHIELKFFWWYYEQFGVIPVERVEEGVVDKDFV